MVNEKEQIEKIEVMLKYNKKLKMLILMLAKVDEQLDSYKAGLSKNDVVTGMITAREHMDLCAEIAKVIYGPGDDEDDLAEWISYNAQKLKGIVDRV